MIDTGHAESRTQQNVSSQDQPVATWLGFWPATAGALHSLTYLLPLNWSLTWRDHINPWPARLSARLLNRAHWKYLKHERKGTRTPTAYSRNIHKVTNSSFAVIPRPRRPLLAMSGNPTPIAARPRGDQARLQSQTAGVQALHFWRASPELLVLLSLCPHPGLVSTRRMPSHASQDG